MDQYSMSQLADWLEENNDALLANQVQLDPSKVYALIDYLGVLKRPAETYVATKQEVYYATESDHKLNLPDDAAPLANAQDRIMVNHVDGSIEDDDLNFTYNHEPVFEGGYQPQRDLNIIKYGFEVIGAVTTSGHLETVGQSLSKDALVTFIIAAAAFAAAQA